MKAGAILLLSDHAVRLSDMDEKKHNSEERRGNVFFQ